MNRETQEKMILKHLQEGHSITPLQALNMFNCLRLSGRIYDIKNKGYVIKDQFITLPNGKRVKEYFI